MDFLIVGFGLLALIILANVLVVRGRGKEQFLFHVVLFVLNLPILLIGLMMAITPAEQLASAMSARGLDFDNIQSVGLILMLMAIWGAVVALGPVRGILANLMPLDPASPVHTLALLLAGYLVGQSALTLSQGGLSGLAEVAQPASVIVFVLSEALFVLIAFLGVGFLIRRRGRQLLNRLGLERPLPRQLLVGSAVVAVLVVLQAIAGTAWALIYPEQAEVLNSVNTLLLANVDTAWEWLLLALAAGVGEELLFRGALQPTFGLGFTAVLFALIHVQYGFTPITLFIVLLAIILGLVRRYYNTTIAIFVHVGYDFVLGLFALLATYLESFVS